MVDTVASFEGRSIIKLYVPIWLSLVGAGFVQEVLRRPGTVGQVSRMAESRAVTIERAQNDLAYDPRSFEAGLERTREMEREEW
jgi:nucleoside-diphosphate-sugar epimerase